MSENQFFRRHLSYSHVFSRTFSYLGLALQGADGAAHPTGRLQVRVGPPGTAGRLVASSGRGGPADRHRLKVGGKVPPGFSSGGATYAVVSPGFHGGAATAAAVVPPGRLCLGGFCHLSGCTEIGKHWEKVIS